MSFMSSIAKFFKGVSPIPLPKAAGELPHPLPSTGSRPLGRITRYGYATDSTPDSLTRAGLGFRNNKLRSSSLAVSRDIETSLRSAGIEPLAPVELTLVDGTKLVRTWDDRTAVSYKGRPLVGRFDIYCPYDEDKHLDGLAIVSFRKP